MEASGSPLVRPMIGHNVSRRLFAILALGMGLVHPACGRFGYDLSAASGDAGSGGTGLGGGAGGGDRGSQASPWRGHRRRRRHFGGAGIGGGAGISGGAGLGAALAFPARGGAGISGGAGAGGSAGTSGSGGTRVARAPGQRGHSARGHRRWRRRRGRRWRFRWRGHRGRGRTGGAACTPATFGGHAYAYCDGPLTWMAARSDCAAKGMRLVRVDDMAENSWLASVAFAGAQLVGRILVLAGRLRPACRRRMALDRRRAVLAGWLERLRAERSLRQLAQQQPDGCWRRDRLRHPAVQQPLERLGLRSPATLRLRTVLSVAPARFASGRTSSARPSHRPGGRRLIPVQRTSERRRT